MTEPSYGVGYLTPAEQRQAELTVQENAMLPSGANKKLAEAGYAVIDVVNYGRLREMCSDWVYAQQQYRQCSECINYADTDLMVGHPVTGRLICFDCVKLLAEECADDDDDEGMERLFEQIHGMGRR